MARILLGVVFTLMAAAPPGWAQDPPRVPAIQESEMQPGYGVVESVQEVRVVPERSAAAGGTAPGLPEKDRPAYRVTVRMADGSVQQRDLHKPEFKQGDAVLLTNAGDIVED